MKTQISILAALTGIFFSLQSVAQNTALPPVNSSYSNLNNAVWGYKTNWPSGRSWDMDMSIYYYDGYGLLDVTRTSAKYNGLADYFGMYVYGQREWDYSFHKIKDGISGDGDTINAGPFDGYYHEPADRADAYHMMRSWFITKLKKDIRIHAPAGAWIQTMSGHYLYQHCSTRWGGNLIDEVCSEIGENIRNTNIHTAFTRGAARQYGKSWGMQFSPWYGLSVLDYTTPNPPWGIYSDPNGGHSLELFKRSYYTIFMSGANIQHLEATSVNWFNNRTKDANGCMSLSPLGLIGHEYRIFTQKWMNQRGIPYTPVAIVLDSLHGVNQVNNWTVHGNVTWDKTIWEWFDQTPADKMTMTLFNAIFPYSFQYTDNEGTGFSVNAPYGDVFDVFTEDVSLAVLQTYPVVYLSGNIQPGAAMSTALTNYVNGGGTLVINASQITPSIPSSLTGVTKGTTTIKSVTGMTWLPSGDLITGNETLNLTSLTFTAATVQPLITSPAGDVIASINYLPQGRVIVVADAYSANATLTKLLMKHLTAETVPFKIEGDIQYLLNRSSDGWLITLVNNKGITKRIKQVTEINPVAVATVTVTLLNESVVTGSVMELRSETTVPMLTANSFQVQIQPGDVRIYKITVSDPLPVTMIYFDAKKENNDVELTWATALEKDNDHFTIERSTDGIHFFALGEVKGNGSISSIQNYSFTDLNVPEVKLYYRLAQYDNNGSVHYSEIKVIAHTDDTGIIVAPNPFSNTTTVFLTNVKDTIQIRVYDLQGRIMQSLISEQSGEVVVGSELPSGVYIIEVTSDETVQRFKVEKK